GHDDFARLAVSRLAVAADAREAGIGGELKFPHRLSSLLARRLSPVGLPAALLQRNDLGLLGIKGTTRLAHAYSQHRNRHLVDTRLRDAPRHLELIDTELAGTSVPEMHDGWALDTSRSLPHLDRLLEEMNSVIEEFGLTPGETYGKP